MQRNIRANVSGQVATDVRLLERACGPGADVQAAWYRLSMLQMVGLLRMLSRWLHDGELADALFKFAAVFPMKRMSVGESCSKSFRSMCRDFLRKLREKNNQSGFHGA